MREGSEAEDLPMSLTAVDAMAVVSEEAGDGESI